MALPVSYNLRNLFVRRVATLMTAGGIACVVAVFIVVLALAEGFRQSVSKSGSPENAILLRDGATSELSSAIDVEAFAMIRTLPGVAQDADGQPLATGEVVLVINHPKLDDGEPTNVSARGVSANVMEVRPEVEIAEGRMFSPGSSEIIVGRALSQRIQDCQLGGVIRQVNRDWTVVGIFDAGDSAFESEIWGDVDVMRDAFKRRVYQSVTVRLENEGALEQIQARLADDPRLKTLQAKREDAYYEEQAGPLSEFITYLGTAICIVMAVGAIVGAVNTMYAAVANRRREIGTLLAIGFGPFSVFLSFLFECLLICFVGGVLGCLLAWPIDGVRTGTTNWQTFSEMAFPFRVTPELMGIGILFALLMGLVGGVLPAYRAARQPVVEALRRG
ncbi:MAG: FtsX-like permease family protein [Planctomycetota bacterium]